jgi:hypothetical protein
VAVYCSASSYIECCAAVDFAHDSRLSPPVVVVTLDDAQGVDPEIAKLKPACKVYCILKETWKIRERNLTSECLERVLSKEG